MLITSALSHFLITKEVFVLSVLGKGLSIDEKRLIIETEPKSFFTAPFLTSIVVWSKINSSADEG